MRVIAGIYKGRILHTVSDLKVRPATDRVKGAIFNMLQNRVNMHGASVLDLYAGSGSIGIEALSRGAGKAVFVENDRQALRSLRDNLATIGAEEDSIVVAADVDNYLQTGSQPYDVVFADPPYAIENLRGLPSTIFQSGCVNDKGYLIMEHPAHTEFAPSSLWEIAVSKKYGRTSVTFFHHRKPDL